MTFTVAAALIHLSLVVSIHLRFQRMTLEPLDYGRVARRYAASAIERSRSNSVSSSL